MTVDPLPAFPDSCWPVDLSCCPDWWEVDPDTEEPVPAYPEHDRARAIALAGQTMRLLTGYRVGGCPVKVRPCKARCAGRTWQTYPVQAGSGSTPWFPVHAGGQWLNVGCGCAGACSCSVICEVRLPYPAGSVTAVRVDGMLLDPTAYRVDPGGSLVRVDGECWPLCQDLAAPDTEDGTFSVEYVPGDAVDGLGAAAAGLLACEYVKACAGDDCALPAGVTQVVRQGVTLTIGAGAFPGGVTGIREVDAYIARWNPEGMREQARFYAPGAPGTRRVR